MTTAPTNEMLALADRLKDAVRNCARDSHYKYCVMLSVPEVEQITSAIRLAATPARDVREALVNCRDVIVMTLETRGPDTSGFLLTAVNKADRAISNLDAEHESVGNPVAYRHISRATGAVELSETALDDTDFNRARWIEDSLYISPSALSNLDAAAPAAGGDDWQDDPSSDERWNAGLDYAMARLCKVLGVDPKSVNWDAATEELEGDVLSVIGNIMRAKYGEDWSADAAPPLQAPAFDLPKRPFAFAVRRAPENGPDQWRLFMDEGEARAEAEQLDGDYEALFRVGDRRSAIAALQAPAHSDADAKTIELAKGRLSAMRIAPPTGLESSRKAAEEIEAAFSILEKRSALNAPAAKAPAVSEADVGRALKIKFIEMTMHHPVGQYTDRLDHVFAGMAAALMRRKVNVVFKYGSMSWRADADRCDQHMQIFCRCKPVRPTITGSQRA